MRVAMAVMLVSCSLMCSGCKEEVSAAPEKAETAPPKGSPQPKLSVIKLWLGPHELKAEQALTSRQVQTGMMFRTEMAEDEAMLFIFPVANQVAFYMKNTLIPLSCAYIDPEGKIVEIHDMTPLDERPIESESNRIQYVLEVRQGWFKRHNINPGTVLRTERGSLSETYFGR